MTEFRYTLVADGPSDRTLIPALTWLLQQYLKQIAIVGEPADFRDFKHPPKGLADKIIKALEAYPCELLFVHRDAENQPPSTRVTEIRTALSEAAAQTQIRPAVCIVPVRMQETWLLIDSGAICKAVGNPNWQRHLKLPQISTLENLPQPKDVLYELLREATNLPANRRRKFRPQAHVHQITELIDDFAPLRQLPAFQTLEQDLLTIINEQGWNTNQ